MKLIEVIKNGKKILIGEGEKGIKSPIELRITIDEGKFAEIEEIANKYKWPIYDALEEILFSNPKEIIETAEMKLQGIL